MKKFFLKLLGNFWLILILCYLLVISITINISDIVITNNSIVIFFIGVLASIVVIGNLAQVYAIKTELD